jgi:hypothetical protein
MFEGRGAKVAREFYCEVMGQLLGPVEPADLKRMAKSGELKPTDRIRQGNNGKWVEARKAKGLFDQQRSTVEPKPVAPPSPESEQPASHASAASTTDDDAIASWLGTPEAPSGTTSASPAADWSRIDLDEGDSFDKSLFSSESRTVRATPPEQRKNSCPLCGEEILEVAKKCKRCGEALDTNLRRGAAAQQASGPNQKKKPFAIATTKVNSVVGCATTVVLLACCGGIRQLISRNTDNQPSTSPSPSTPALSADSQQPAITSRPSPARSQAAIESEERIGAIEAAKTFVKRQLAHPSSASFPWFDSNAKRQDDGSWLVFTTVKAKNSFNLEIKYDCLVRVMHVGSEWSLIDIGMEESRE